MRRGFQRPQRDWKVLCQGITGKQATYHVGLSLTYGTSFVGGVSPGREGGVHLGIPLFRTVEHAVQATNANVSLVCVPARFAKDAILEAIESGIELIVCITEGIPVQDLLPIKQRLASSNSLLIGPNSPGILIPPTLRLGTMPPTIHQPGCVGIVSRSGTLSYAVAAMTTRLGLGQSMSIGIGGDLLVGTDFVEILRTLEADTNTERIVLLGEIGGLLEQEAARYIHTSVTKPVIAYIVGWSVPTGKTMGHAGAMILGKQDSSAAKQRSLERAGVTVVRTLGSLEACLCRFAPHSGGYGR